MFKDFHDKYNCIFIHIPKAAGTSIERVVFESDGWLSGHVSANDYVRYDRAKFEGYFSFAFVRNPFDRMVSAFHYLKAGGGNEKDSKWARDNLSDYESFEEFILALRDEDTRERILKWVHFVPQYKFVCDESKNVLVNFIGRVENIERDFLFIKKQLGFERDLIHTNTSRHNDFSHYYNSESYSIVAEIYRDDFILFDYDLDYEEYIYGREIDTMRHKLDSKNSEITNLRLKEYEKNIEIRNLKGSAIDIVHDDLEYKLGEAMMQYSNNIFDSLKLPFILSYIIHKHLKDKEFKKQSINLESYPDYREALKEKDGLIYKIGERYINQNNNGGGGGQTQLFLLLDLPKLKRRAE